MMCCESDRQFTDNDVPTIDVAQIRTDDGGLVRRAGKRSLHATVWWCLATVPCIFAGRLIGVAILCGAIFQLVSTLKWLGRTAALSEQEHTRWSIWLGLLTVLVAIVAFIHLINIAVPILRLAVVP